MKKIKRISGKRLEEGRRILKDAARYLAKSHNFGYHLRDDQPPDYYLVSDMDVVTAEERPLFDSLYILACMAHGWDLQCPNVYKTALWLVDEAEDQNVGVFRAGRT